MKKKQQTNTLKYEVIDEAVDLLLYKSKLPIIYLANYHFLEKFVSKGKRNEKEHILKEQLYCNNSDFNWWLKEFRNRCKIKEDREFVLQKVVLKKKLAYSNII